MTERKPEWLRVSFHGGQDRMETEKLLSRLSLNTVCEEASCPNRMECFSRKTATFMILGSTCTRNCTFCDVRKGNPAQVDGDEPLHVAQAVKELGLKHVVVTSVTRDDLPDGGAGHFAAVIEKIRALTEDQTVVEVLIPDFKGDRGALEVVAAAGPRIINHNIETVPRLYSSVRPIADYQRSLKLLENIKALALSIYSKSGIMVGLGEREEEVEEVMGDLKAVGCDFLTIGQYLSPSKKHHPVIEYIHPEVFERYRQTALGMGFRYVASAPLVRSSYLAEQALREMKFI